MQTTGPPFIVKTSTIVDSGTLEIQAQMMHDNYHDRDTGGK